MRASIHSVEVPKLNVINCCIEVGKVNGMICGTELALAHNVDPVHIVFEW
jgi:hypothetical protein